MMNSDPISNLSVSDYLIMVQRSNCDRISLKSRESSSSSFGIPIKNSHQEMVLNPTG